MKYSFFSKYNMCSKSVETEAVFSSKYEAYSNIIKTKAVFTKTKMNNEWNINFLPNSSLVILCT